MQNFYGGKMNAAMYIPKLTLQLQCEAAFAANRKLTPMREHARAWEMGHRSISRISLTSRQHREREGRTVQRDRLIRL
ncbi:hypothetical protein AAII07_35695 [Microvirga sp. 0TCS3.31]